MDFSRIRLPKHIYLIVLVAVIGGAIFFLRGGAPSSASRDGVAMDTLVTIRLSSDGALTHDDLNKTLGEMFDELARLEKIFSMTDASSELARFNDASAGSAIKISRDLWSALETARDLASITGGAYDPTIGAITKLWRRDGVFRVPSSDEISRALTVVSSDLLELAPDSAKKTKRGVAIDLGGIAKGIASARLAAIARSGGASSALINLGGNIMTMGDRPGGGTWRIGVRRPDGRADDALLAISSPAASVITAGVYERRWSEDDTEYTHIYDPSTGMPVSGDLLSVTVITDDPTAGDALSTAFMVLGLDRSVELMSTMPDVEAIFVFADGSRFRAVATDGLEDAIDSVDRSCSLSFVKVIR